LPRVARLAAAQPSSTSVLRPVPSVAREPAQPIIKWAGGKSKLLPELLQRLPSEKQWTGRYFEPFVGGAALYLALRPHDAQLTDMNAELVNLYTVVRDDVAALIDDLANHAHEREHYYAVRALDTAALSTVERASRFVFLNRTCFNGLYRVNRQGQFNVPFGRYDNPMICPTERLHTMSAALQTTTLAVRDFEDALRGARRGDFVYFDPPYVPLTRTANFTSYTSGAFDESDQQRLATLMRDLGRRGVRCMLSNSDTPFTRELYAGLNIDAVLAPRAISRNAETRRPVSELIVRNY